MRIAAAEKMGYYPTPPKTLEYVTQLLRPASKGGSFRFLDPCAGQGEALSHAAQALMAQGVQVQTYGVELSDARAAQATEVLDSCICADWADITCSHKGFSLLWLNPPYDDEVGEKDARKRRLEYVFLQNTLKVLQTGGLLVYIVPLKLLKQNNVAKFLAGYFEGVRVYKLPEGEFDRFGQIVVFAYRKANATNDEAEVSRLQKMAETGDVPLLDLSGERVVVPSATLADGKFFIRKISLSPDEVIAAIGTNGVHSTRHWADMLRHINDGAFTPVVPLRTGHVGSLISSGQMGTVQLNDVLAKGRSIKIVEHLDAKGNHVTADSPDVARERERFETRVFTLANGGEFTELATVAHLQQFLEGNAGAIAEVMAKRYEPLYAKPTLDEWNKLSKLLKSKPLPGRKTSGLLPAQKHVAIAASRSVQHQGWVDIIAEMGCGKTAMSLSTLELIPDAYPAIVLCPGHIVQKWAREVEEVIPGATGIVIDSLKELVEFERTYTPGDKVVVIISKERAKLGSGWEPATVTRQVRFKRTDNQTGETKTVTRTVHSCPTCGGIVTDEEGLALTKLPTKRLHCQAIVKRWTGDPQDKTKGTVKEVPCNAPLFQKTGFRRWPLSLYMRTKMKGFFKVLIADEFHLFKGKSTDQSGSYHDLVMATKYTINLTGTLFGGKSTDLFWLRYRIDSEVRADFDFHDEIRWAEMYGRLERTIKVDDVADGVYSGRRRWVSQAKEIPGISPAIFARLLKSCIFMRITDLGFKLPPYDEHIIHIPMDDTQAEQYNALNDALMAYIATSWDSSGHDRAVSQKLLGVWLQNCLGRVNSGFRPETVMYSVNKDVKLPVPVHGPALDKLSGWSALEEPPLVADFLEGVPEGAIKEDDIVLWPDSYGEYALHLEPVVPEGALLPKEQWLVDYCLHEQQQQRKVLVYVRQTGTRDIQPRLQSILEEAGLRAVILPDSVEPKKREKWIRDRAGDIDVLITNPRKVETGLDLVMFSTAIFYEIEYSLFTIWQAMRRVWRLGQTQPVKVLFPIYSDSMESAALALMGQKMQAALLLYGDNAASAITDEAGGSGDFTAELAAKILEGEELSSDGITGLLKHTIPDEDDMPIWETPEEEAEVFTEAETFTDFVKTWASWSALQGNYVERCLERAAKRRRKKKEPELQLVLFSEETEVEEVAADQLQMTLF
jgi:16S rRNA G966 N2-methylase RsmD